MEFSPDSTIRLSFLGGKLAYNRDTHQLLTGAFHDGEALGRTAINLRYLRSNLPEALCVFMAAKCYLLERNQAFIGAEDARYLLEFNGAVLTFKRKAWSSPTASYADQEVVINLALAWDKRFAVADVLEFIVDYLN